jgi:hypothetical protein
MISKSINLKKNMSFWKIIQFLILLFRDRTNPLDFLSDQQIIRNYRLDREGIYTLCDELQEDLEKVSE